jgi:hypothetical protein
MRKTMVTVLLSGLVLAGCGSGDGDTANEKSPPPGSPTSAPTLAAEAAGGDGEGLKDQAAFLEAMRRIDPRLVRDEGKATSVAENLCQELEQGTDPIKVAAHAATQYSGNGLVVDMEPSKQIVKALQQHACHP